MRKTFILLKLKKKITSATTNIMQARAILMIGVVRSRVQNRERVMQWLNHLRQPQETTTASALSDLKRIVKFKHRAVQSKHT